MDDDWLDCEITRILWLYEHNPEEAHSCEDELLWSVIAAIGTVIEQEFPSLQDICKRLDRLRRAQRQRLYA